jgi:hypothetical protein
MNEKDDVRWRRDLVGRPRKRPAGHRAFDQERSRLTIAEVASAPG